MLNRRALLASSAATLSAPAGAPRAQPATPGATANEILIGSTMPYSGPASAWGAIGRGLEAFFRMVNDGGGVAGRRIEFLARDDGYSPPKALEQTRRLIEQDRVAFLFASLGTATNSAIVRYVNQRRVPHLFVTSGADKWADPAANPWTLGWLPSYRTEAQICAKHLLAEHPEARLGVLLQHDDLGRDYLAGVRDVFGARFERQVRAVSHEVTDATVDSQVLDLQSGGADALLTATSPKFAAQTIRRVHDLGWRPRHYLASISVSVASVIQPAGPEKAVGIVSASVQKDIRDPTWQDDPGLAEWRAFMGRWLPAADLSETNYLYAYGVGLTMLQVLRQCDGDFSRERVMREALSLRDLAVPNLLPGIRVSTAPDNYRPIRHMQLRRWSGTA